MLFNNANRGANGNAATNNVTNPYCRTVAERRNSTSDNKKTRKQSFPFHGKGFHSLTHLQIFVEQGQSSRILKLIIFLPAGVPSVVILGRRDLRSLAPPIPHLRREDLDEIVETLLADHYNRELDTDFGEATSGIAHVRLDAIKLGRPRIRVSGMDEKSSLNNKRI